MSRRKDAAEAVKSLVEWAVAMKKDGLKVLSGTDVLETALGELTNFPSRLKVRRDGDDSLLLEASGLTYRITVRSV